jgi:hypothetical protein
MLDYKASPIGDRPAEGPKVVAILAKNKVVEIWHIHREREDFEERDVELPKEVRTRTMNGHRESYDVHRRQLSRHEWGYFVIRRYKATRMLPGTRSLGLMMLIPGTLLAAGSASQEARVSAGMLIIQSALVAIGGLLSVASGWPLLRRLQRCPDGVPLESLGVSGHKLGFPDGALASESLPRGYRPGRFRGELQIDAPVGRWNVVKVYSYDLWWHRTS